MAQTQEQFGKYFLLERLAVGGMAEVYLAKSAGAEGVNKFVAIKRILPQFSDHPEFIEMFKEEAKITVNLKHGNVVSIYDFGVEKNQFYIVMEYVEGRNLRQMINELKKLDLQLNIEQIVYLIKEVSAGLDHAHRCLDGNTGKPLNIVHRDMSPQNIMVTFEGEFKIIDFGIAKAETQIEATRAGTLKGKYGYMSPEQADGQSIDPRSDIFSLGIILWELLANDRLFTSSSEAAILRKIRECEIPAIRKLNPSVPQELEKIVHKALAKDKSIRYQTAAALHRDLNRFLNMEYPDYSSHDFSIFIKNTFSDIYLLSRQKLVDHSKPQSADEQINEKTIVTQTHTEAPRGAIVKLAKPTAPPKLDPILSKENPSARDPSRTTITPPFAQQPPPLVRPSHPKVSRSKSPTRSLAALAKVASVLLVVGGGWLALNNTGERKTPISTTPLPRAEIVASSSEPIEQPSTAPDYVMNIYSEPDHARIFIDGLDTGDYTPSRKTVKANTAIELRLVKEGYRDFNTTLTPTHDAFSFTGTLPKLTQTASVMINLINGGANPELLIAGVQVPIKPEGSYYIVEGDTSVNIAVRNKNTGLQAEATITVPVNQKKTIDLYLKK